MLIPLDFETDEGFGSRARIGVVVLETDRTLEPEMRMVQLDGVDWYHSRIPMDVSVTPDTLTSMEQNLPTAAALLPVDFGFDAIGYGCTSAATLIGESGVTAAIQSAHPHVACTNPITAAVAAFRALGAERIGVVTPYTEDVTAPIVDHFGQQGLTVTAVGSFLEGNDLVVGRISEASVAAAARHIDAMASCDAVFVSCTSLRAFGIVQALEVELDKPVVSSNLAFTWHLLRLAGVDDPVAQLGRLGQLAIDDRMPASPVGSE